MRFFSWLITGLVIAIIIAALTAPNDDRFKKFVDNRADTTTTAIIGKSKAVEFLSVRLFSFHHVDYFEKTQSPKPVGGLGKRRMFKKLRMLHRVGSERYLGLYGKFWKLESN